VDAQHAVAVLFTQVGHIRAAGFEDAQAKQAEQAYQRQVVAIGGVAGGDEQRLELQVGQPQRR
jgi:hypothetical protein